MTPREKATELVNKMYDHINCWNDKGQADYALAMDNAKVCALIAVNEILGDMGADRGYSFWTEVKQEIESL